MKIEREEKGKIKIFSVQNEFKQRERRQKIWKFILVCLGLIGLSPLLASVVVGWLLSPFYVSWSLVIGGLVVSMLCMFASKYVWF